MKIAVVDYGLANIQSVVNAIECFPVEVYLATSGDTLAAADKIILPGVGSFDAGMLGLRERGHVAALNQAVIKERMPCMGICLGFQFLFEGSEEGDEPGLGWLQGQICCFDKNSIKVPHIGWNELLVNNQTKLFHGIESPADVYFVHSFYAPDVAGAAEYAIGRCEYGINYVAAIEKDNIFGVQFHPEKSQLTGMKILENFIFHNENEA